MTNLDILQTHVNSALLETIMCGSAAATSDLADTDLLVLDLDACTDVTPAWTYCG
ncbi:hypothetical protein [Luedemannella helvata]|uniref:Uncharacterized protein n=1 Tax=Luedemannella helvata TaxID=349315 RepID=A0ABN2JUV1_9ACTN